MDLRSSWDIFASNIGMRIHQEIQPIALQLLLNLLKVLVIQHLIRGIGGQCDKLIDVFDIDHF